MTYLDNTNTKLIIFFFLFIIVTSQHNGLTVIYYLIIENYLNYLCKIFFFRQSKYKNNLFMN